MGTVPDPAGTLVPLDVEEPFWERVFAVSPLVLVGTREADGGYDLAPKHMAMPVGWSAFYCFVCAPRHGTYRNVLREGTFTVSFPAPEQIVSASLAATAREADHSKPALGALATIPARVVDGVLVAGAHLHLECELDRVIDGFGENSLVIGRVVAAWATEGALRSVERDDADVVREQPLLAYLAPGRFACIDDSRSFPFPTSFRL